MIQTDTASCNLRIQYPLRDVRLSGPRHNSFHAHIEVCKRFSTTCLSPHFLHWWVALLACGSHLRLQKKKTPSEKKTHGKTGFQRTKPGGGGNQFLLLDCRAEALRTTLLKDTGRKRGPFPRHPRALPRGINRCREKPP